MDFTFKEYDPSRPKQQPRQRRRVKTQELKEKPFLPGPPDGERLDSCVAQPSGSDHHCSPIEDLSEDPDAALPSREESLSHCLALADGSSASTPASADSLGFQTDPTTQRYGSQDSALAVEDSFPRGRPRQSCSSLELISDDARAREVSATESNRISLAQSTENLRFLASTATTKLDGRGGANSAESAQVPNTGPFPPKRLLPERDTSGGTEERNPEHNQSLKRVKRSSFDTPCYPPLTPDDTHSVPACRRASPPGRVSEEASLQLLQIPTSRAIQSPNPSGSGISLAAVRQLLEDQTKQLLERRTEQLLESFSKQLDSQSMQISLLTAEVESLKRKASSNTQADERPNVENDDSDSESDSESDSDGEDDRTELKSVQRRKWTASDEALLGRLKLAQSNHGSPSDHIIAEKLKRSVEAVKQHWTIMQKMATQSSRGPGNKTQRNKRKARSSL